MEIQIKIKEDLKMKLEQFVDAISNTRYFVNRMSGENPDKIKYQGNRNLVRIHLALNEKRLHMHFIDGEDFISTSPISKVLSTENGAILVFTQNKDLYILAKE